MRINQFVYHNIHKQSSIMQSYYFELVQNRLSTIFCILVHICSIQLGSIITKYVDTWGILVNERRSQNIHPKSILEFGIFDRKFAWLVAKIVTLKKVWLAHPQIGLRDLKFQWNLRGLTLRTFRESKKTFSLKMYSKVKAKISKCQNCYFWRDPSNRSFLWSLQVL